MLYTYFLMTPFAYIFPCPFTLLHLLLTGWDRVGYLLEMSTIKTTRLIVHRNNTCKVPLVSSPFLVLCVCKSGGGRDILGWSRRCSSIWTKKQVESAEAAVGTRMVFCIKIHWRTALCKGWPGCGQLEQGPDGQGALMEAGWATSHG